MDYMHNTNEYYISDYSGFLSGPYQSIKEAETDAVDGEAILKFVKFASAPTEITKAIVDFDNGLLTLSGSSKASIKIGEKVLAVGTHKFNKKSESCEGLLNVLSLNCNDVSVIGTPYIEGECLDYLVC